MRLSSPNILNLPFIVFLFKELKEKHLVEIMTLRTCT